MSAKSPDSMSTLKAEGWTSPKTMSTLPRNLVTTGISDKSGNDTKQSGEFDRVDIELAIGDKFLSPDEVGQLLKMASRSIKRNAVAGLFPGAKKATENGVEVWRIPFASLPQEAQAAYLLAHAPRRTPEEEKAHIRKLNAKNLADALVDAESGGPAPRTKLLPVPILEHNQQSALWESWERAPAKLQEKAKRALLRMQFRRELIQSGMTVETEIEAAIRAEFDGVETSHATLWRYRQRIEGQPGEIWLPLLLPDYSGGNPP